MSKDLPPWLSWTDPPRVPRWGWNPVLISAQGGLSVTRGHSITWENTDRGSVLWPWDAPWSPTIMCTAWEWVMPASPWCPLEALIVVLYREDALEDSPGVQMVMGCQGHMRWGVGERLLHYPVHSGLCASFCRSRAHLAGMSWAFRMPVPRGAGPTVIALAPAPSVTEQI